MRVVGLPPPRRRQRRVVLRHERHRQGHGRRVPPPPLLREPVPPSSREDAQFAERARDDKAAMLQDYKHLLRLRSLLARGRALIGPRNPDVVARLFGGRFDAWATFPHQRLAGVPDPAFWLVMEYWRLGNWRRP